MSLIGWVASHTGLPSFYAVGTGDLVAEDPVFGWDHPRLVTVVVGDVLVSDAGAGAGVPTEYRFGGTSVTLTRKGASTGGETHQWVTDSAGQTVAGVTLLGDDPREYATEAEVFTSALGVHIPRYPLGAPPPTGTLEFSTQGAGTETLRAFTRARSPLWVVHDAGACQLPGCDIEGARLVVPHRMSEVRSPRRDVAARYWSVEYSRVPDHLGDLGSRTAHGVPVVTWGQWARVSARLDGEGPIEVYTDGGRVYADVGEGFAAMSFETAGADFVTETYESKGF